MYTNQYRFNCKLFYFEKLDFWEFNFMERIQNKKNNKACSKKLKINKQIN